MKTISNLPPGTPLLLFDGVCNLCNGAVQWIIRHDPAGKIHFAALQSEVGQQILKQGGLSAGELSTVVLYYQDQIYTRSDAALEVLRLLGGAWSLLYLLKHLPRSVRNMLYNQVAQHRYKWFGKRDSCMIPTPELKSRFVD